MVENFFFQCHRPLLPSRLRWMHLPAANNKRDSCGQPPQRLHACKTKHKLRYCQPEHISGAQGRKDRSQRDGEISKRPGEDWRPKKHNTKGKEQTWSSDDEVKVLYR